jgi:hypothetical protein
MLSSAALAAPPSPPKGTGNFRRADGLDGVGAKNATTARVVGATSADRKATGLKMPKESRVLMVEHDGGKVDLVRAPLDKSAHVHQMGKAEANRMGLVTQAQAKEQATHNGGLLGQRGAVGLKNEGISSGRGSYEFRQTNPSTKTVKWYGMGPYKASNIYRDVSVNGKGETASAAMNPIKK